MSHRWLLVLVWLAVTGVATAETIPGPSRGDSRLRYAVYNMDQVYQVRAEIGRAFFLQFGPDEEMESWYSGDSKAWQVAKHGNVMALKPMAQDPTTNIIVVTSAGRTYVIDVVLGHPAMYGIRFRYPGDEATKAAATHTQKVLEAALDPQRQTQRNLRYSASGNRELGPSEIFDNGRYTFMRFPENQAWPALFAVAADGSEALANRTVRGNWLILTQVGRLWRLRAGTSVLCIRNDAFAPAGADNRPETASPSIWRQNVGTQEGAR